MKILKKHDFDWKRYINGPQDENAKCKVIIKPGEKKSLSTFCYINFGFTENPRLKPIQPRIRAMKNLKKHVFDWKRYINRQTLQKPNKLFRLY